VSNNSSLENLHSQKIPYNSLCGIFLYYYYPDMKVKIYWTEENANELISKVKIVLDELGLVDFIEVEGTQDEALKAKLNITKDTALIIEEESIDFQDMIFEGMIPNDDELKSMFVSIIWGEGSGWCGSKDSEGSCGTGCSCH
jgi:hypothetical protein